ncbi:single-stranded-DNA-specific exonuclease RecJ [Vagococcus vulneris]|uniref:single-stranded-DNA-specific exonuclease RecJ n=1 Tax=Vagococcus vulneris TaxID=1977869 RepID=UPI00140310A8|nr:single-stranded-DNA-specific exonuclease RecJ [Vagococcus vulneris]
MRESEYKWEQLNQDVRNDELTAALKDCGLSENLVPFLIHRGINTANELSVFLNPSLEDLHDPLLLHDMDKSIKRVQDAVMNDQKILIYGDYDADGITSTTVMKDTLELIGANVSYYLPNRFKDGYGPNLAVYQDMIENQGVQLIITVDNGVSGHEAIAYAKAQGVDVIVTDHHELPDTLPDAFAIVHPKHPESNYPFKELAGVGVAFKFATALLGETPLELIDLVAIGSIADMVPLVGENRSLVKLGIDMMRQSDRVGLHALAELAGTPLQEINEETIGFQFAPRLNALGRLGDASPGVELLSTFDEEKAAALAEFIQTTNVKRQEIVSEITEEALKMLATEQEQPMNILVKDGWHEGVLGIVANKIVKTTHKPTLVLTRNSDTGIIKGSGRSIEAVDLFKLLNQVKDLLLGFGGHYMAAGLSFEADKLDLIKDKLNQILRASDIDLSQKDVLVIDESLHPQEISITEIKRFDSLRPFGMDNPIPTVRVVGNQINQLKQIGSDKSHLKFELDNSGSKLDCIGFSMGNQLTELLDGDQYEIVGQLSINEWNGRQKPQLMVKDFKVDGMQILDIRGKKYHASLIQNDSCINIYFDEKFKDSYTDLPNLLWFNDLSADSSYQRQLTDRSIVILDCPPSMEVAEELFSYCDLNRIYIKADVDFDHYMQGIPNRTDFGKLFKVIKQFPTFDIRYKLPDLARYLKIDKNQLIFMIKVFFELGFVTIDDGVMSMVENPTQHPLTDSKEYQAYLKRIEAEKLFVYSDVSDIKKWLLLQEEAR